MVNKVVWPSVNDDVIIANWDQGDKALSRLLPSHSISFIRKQRIRLGFKRPGGRTVGSLGEKKTAGHNKSKWAPRDISSSRIEHIISPPPQHQAIERVALPGEIKFKKSKYAGTCFREEIITRRPRILGACVTQEILGGK